MVESPIETLEDLKPIIIKEDEVFRPFAIKPKHHESLLNQWEVKLEIPIGLHNLSGSIVLWTIDKFEISKEDNIKTPLGQIGLESLSNGTLNFEEPALLFGTRFLLKHLYQWEHLKELVGKVIFGGHEIYDFDLMANPQNTHSKLRLGEEIVPNGPFKDYYNNPCTLILPLNWDKLSPVEFYFDGLCLKDSDS